MPQSFILVPNRFNLYNNDIATFGKTNLALYADDTVIYADLYYGQLAKKNI